MKTLVKKKLTPAQTAVLSYLSKHPSADYYDILKCGANASTMKKLVVMELVRVTEKDGYKEWSPMHNGGIALSLGYCYSAQPIKS